ncbi:MAG: hypothetical protein EBR81_14385 [Proteobacteria bacterium]|nr:hypothetical protein [Pseudomonadota bacterium]
MDNNPKSNHERVNQFLADEEAKISAQKDGLTVSDLPPDGVEISMGNWNGRGLTFPPLLSKTTKSTGTYWVSIPKTTVKSSEFPEGGEPRFRRFLAKMLETHVKKAADYGSREDIFANCRGSEPLGIPAWQGVVVRMGDKMARLHTAAREGKLSNESVEDAFLDLANYAVIGAILYQETLASEKCCGGNCACD